MTERLDLADFWGYEEDDILTHGTIYDFVIGVIEPLYKLKEPLPEKVEAVGFARKKIEVDLEVAKEYIQQEVQEWMMDEYDNPEDPLDWPAPLVEALEVFAKAVCEHYPVCQCEPVARKTVDCREFVKRHRQHWEPEWEGESDEAQEQGA